jgi:hypothetical protein
MPAVYVSPGGSTNFPILQASTHADQIGMNVVPTNQTLSIETSPHCNVGFYVHTHVQQTDRDYTGGDTVRSVKTGVVSWNVVDNNDPTWNPIAINCAGFESIVVSGASGPSYGTPINYIAEVFVSNVPSPHGNEYANLYATIIAGGYSNTITGGNYWTFDMALHGPIGQPGLLAGLSYVTNNHFNGSPSSGKATAVCIQTDPHSGGQNNDFELGSVYATTYPWDIGYFISGYSTGGTGDGYTNAVQVGGIPGTWHGSGQTYGGDQGQVARAVVVKANNAGTSVARLGAFVSEGIGEGGGLVFGLDTNDANRVSVFRPASGVLELNGKLCLSGEAASTTATPSNVTGKVPIYTSSGTLIGYLPVYGSL